MRDFVGLNRFVNIFLCVTNGCCDLVSLCCSFRVRDCTLGVFTVFFNLSMCCPLVGTTLGSGTDFLVICLFMSGGIGPLVSCGISVALFKICAMCMYALFCL